ncbi:hypothetical protein [Tabrizicola sp.]|uniref:hypothetical protein n=1 Tax=Tabrizicola sp. TaxID=2005166 RepID=UPI00286ACE6D|nr:hypothetical protein [Tabrizicola sp.]
MAQFSTVAEFLDPKNNHAPTKAEHALITACREGRPCILGDGTLPPGPTPDRTIRADLLRLLITGATPACGLHPSGVWLQGAHIPETLDLRFTKCRGRCALDACRFDGKPQFEQAKFAQLSLRGSHLPGLFAQDMKVKGGLFLRNLTAKGTVDVNGTKIGGQLVCTGANLDGTNPDGSMGKALNAQGVEVGDSLFLSDMTAKGTVNLASARIGGQLSCVGANFDGAGDVAMYAHGVEIGAGIFLESLTAKGTVYVNDSKIGGSLDCSGANLDGAGGMALGAYGIEVGGIGLGDLTAIGTVHLSGTKIAGQLYCERASLDGGGGEALDAQRLHVAQSFIFRRLKSINGIVRLVAAHVGDLSDDNASWPKAQGELLLDGFTYDRIVAASTDAKDRLPWLERGSTIDGQFRPQPYTQLAKVLRQMGHHRDARLVLAEQARRLGVEARRLKQLKPDGTRRLVFENPLADARHVLSYGFDLLLRGVAGYGHRPFNSVIALAVLFLVATTLAHFTWTNGSFAPNSDVILTSPGWLQAEAADCVPAPLPGCDKNPAKTWSDDPARGLDWDSFNPIGYGADLVIPILDLGQTDAWAPSKDRGDMGWLLWWGRWVLAALGWIVTALGAAAITGIMQRNAPD